MTKQLFQILFCKIDYDALFVLNIQKAKGEMTELYCNLKMSVPESVVTHSNSLKTKN